LHYIYIAHIWVYLYCMVCVCVCTSDSCVHSVVCNTIYYYPLIAFTSIRLSHGHELSRPCARSSTLEKRIPPTSRGRDSLQRAPPTTAHLVQLLHDGWCVQTSLENRRQCNNNNLIILPMYGYVRILILPVAYIVLKFCPCPKTTPEQAGVIGISFWLYYYIVYIERYLQYYSYIYILYILYWARVYIQYVHIVVTRSSIIYIL